MNSKCNLSVPLLLFQTILDNERRIFYEKAVVSRAITMRFPIKNTVLGEFLIRATRLCGEDCATRAANDRFNRQPHESRNND